MSWWHWFADRLPGDRDVDDRSRTRPGTDFYAVLGVPPDTAAADIRRHVANNVAHRPSGPQNQNG